MVATPPRAVHIVGRGIVGLSLGWELARKGWSVTMVGPREAPGTASVAAVGLSSVKGQLVGQKPLFQAKLKGHEFLRGWLHRLELEAGRILPRDLRGVVETFDDMTGYDGIHERVFHREFAGCHRMRLLDRAGLELRGVTRVEARACGGFLYFRDLWFDPRLALEQLEACLLRRGSTFRESPVRAVALGGKDGPSLHCDDGIVPTFRTILACGAASTAVLAASGITHFPMQGVAGETLFGPNPGIPEMLLRRGKTNMVTTSSATIVGSTDYPEGGIRPDPFATLALPVFLLNRRAETHVVSGVRARFRDRCPAVGPATATMGRDGLWVALGFYKNGLQLGPLFAQSLAHWLDSGEPDELSPAFQTTRFFS